MSLFSWIVQQVQKILHWTVGLYLVLAASSLFYSYKHLAIDNDLTHMISDKLPFHQRWIEYKEAFPHLVDTFIVVIEGNSASQAALWLEEKIKQESQFFEYVFRSTKYFADKKNREFIEVKPKLFANELLPQEKSILRLREILKEWREGDVQFKVTGASALGYEEMQSVSWSAGIASLFSLILVSFILFFGLRSIRLSLFSLLTLLVGLSLTLGFTTFFVGHLNMISVAFVTMFIGLGIDYGAHLSLRYRKLCEDGKSNGEALSGAVAQLGTSLLLCTATTAGGFFAFIPTAYAGVSELGLIAGVGMIINLIAYLTFFPSLLHLFPSHFKKTLSLPRTASFLFHYPKTIRGVALGCGVCGLLFLGKLSFDPNPLNLQDPNTEAYKTYREFLKEPGLSPWTIKILEKDESNVKTLTQKLKTIPQVGSVMALDTFGPKSFIPSELKERYLSNHFFRIEVFPKENISEISQMRTFSDAVLKVAPHATDDPVTLPATADAIVAAFLQAALIAFLLCFLLVYFVFKNLKDTLAVFAPLLLGMILTANLLIWFGIQINFANIIVLPLLLGMAIDYAIHFVHKSRQKEDNFHSTTSRAVVISALTTIASFGTLSFSSHRGLASLGILLSLGMIVVLITTLVLVPILVHNKKEENKKEIKYGVSSSH